MDITNTYIHFLLCQSRLDCLAENTEPQKYWSLFWFRSKYSESEFEKYKVESYTLLPEAEVRQLLQQLSEKWFLRETEHNIANVEIAFYNPV